MKRPPPPQKQADAPPTVPRLEQALFIVLLAVLCVRPLISETFEFIEISFLQVFGADSGTTPAATAWLDAIALTAVFGVLPRHWGFYRRRPLALVAFALLALGVLVSTLVAGDKRMALSAGFSLLISVLSGAALLPLMRAPWMPRLLLAAVLATGCATGIRCLTQWGYEFSDTLEFWADHKAQLAAMGVDLNSPTVRNYEQRLRSGETYAYQSHPNVTGALLVMWLLPAAGLAIAWLRERKSRGAERAGALLLAFGVVTLLAFGIALTGSLGAAAFAMAGVALLLFIGLRAVRFSRQPGRMAFALFLAGAVVALAGGMYGWQRGTLPHPSLAFRWYYWTAAGQTFVEHPLTGIGRGNFADAYKLHKPIESTEDVTDPHSLWISLLVELGPAGLLAGLLLAYAVIRGLFRRLASGPAPPGAADVPLLATMALTILLLSLQGLFGSDVLDVYTGFMWSIRLGAAWVLSLVLLAAILRNPLESPDRRRWLTAGIAAGLLAALGHGLMDFALLTPAGLSLFILLAVGGLARPEKTPPPAPRANLAMAVVGLALLSTQLVLVSLPTLRAQMRVLQLRAAATRIDPERAAQFEQLSKLAAAAAESDPLGVYGTDAAARLFLQIGSDPRLGSDVSLRWLEAARELAERVAQRRPRSSDAHVRLARIYAALEEQYLLAARPDDALAALDGLRAHWEQAARLHPADPRKRLAAGRAWVQTWEETDDPAAARRAAAHLEAARAIDATREPGEIVRLREGELAELHDLLNTLREVGFPAPKAAPASGGGG